MKVPTIFELQKLICVVPKRAPFGVRDRCLMVLLANTGLRVSELHGLDVGHVICNGQVPDFFDVSKLYAKGAHSRTLPINANVKKAIQALLAFNRQRGFSTQAHAPLFQDRQHRRLPVRSIQAMIQKYREIAGVSDLITPHKYRHFFATQALAKCHNPRTVQVLLGHWRLATVEIYTHHNPADLQAAVGVG